METYLPQYEERKLVRQVEIYPQHIKHRSPSSAVLPYSLCIKRTMPMKVKTSCGVTLNRCKADM